MRGKLRVLRIDYLERVQCGGDEYYEIWDYEVSSSNCFVRTIRASLMQLDGLSDANVLSCTP